MKRSLVLLCLLTAIVLAGCTPYQMTLTNEERTYPATSPDQIQIFVYGETPKRPTVELGTIIAQAEEKKAIEFIKEKAAGMGADAIVQFEMYVVRIQGPFFIPMDYYNVRGVAVKYTN